MNLRRLVIVLCMIFIHAAMGSAEPPSSMCADGFCFPDKAEVDGVSLTLRGVSTFRYWGFRVYTGALYAPTPVNSPSGIREDIAKKLVLRYHRSVSVDQFVENSQETLVQDPQLSLEQLRPFLSRINSLYVPVREGDTYAITYNPTQSTLRLFFNERLLGEIKSREFARAYFGIWVSDYSVSDKFTDELLGIER